MYLLPAFLSCLRLNAFLLTVWNPFMLSAFAFAPPTLRIPSPVLMMEWVDEPEEEGTGTGDSRRS
jgi:hypothetical protein